MKVFKRFLIYLGLGMLCSLVPFLHYSLVFGLPAVFLNSVILTYIYAKDIGEI